MPKTLLQALIGGKEGDKRNLSESLPSKKASTEPLIGYDFHDTLNAGIVPTKNAVVITGADESHKGEVEGYLKKIGRSDMKVYYRPSQYADSAKGIAEWKTSVIKKLGIKTYYDDADDVVAHLEKMNPDVEIIDVDGSDSGESENADGRRKFFVMSSFGELLDLAIHLKYVEKEKVLFHVCDKGYSKIGEGIVDTADNYIDYLGKDWTWIIDGCETAKLQDWLRKRGEYVIGTNQAMSELEENRQKGQEWFRKAGFKQPESLNFTDIDDALDFVKDNPDKVWVLKQNGGAPKSINHVGKFKDSSDMIYHLEELKKKWNEQEFGAFDCDLMERVDGVEVAASAFFNGHDWLRGADGKVVGFLNFEEKKEHDGNLGDTTGETGTTFYGTDESNEIFKDIILRDEITAMLKKTKYQGVFDINGSLTEDGFVAFEATSRFGIPATSYEFMKGLKSPLADLLCAIAYGEDKSIEIVKGWGMVVVVTAKPFPIEADMEKEATSIGERLWLLKDGKPSTELTEENYRHIHLENFYKDEDGTFKVATKNGYLLVISMTGDDIADCREKIMKYIKENVYVSGMKYRQDIGVRVEKHL